MSNETRYMCQTCLRLYPLVEGRIAFHKVSFMSEWMECGGSRKVPDGKKTAMTDNPITEQQVAEAGEIRQHLFWRISDERFRQDERWGQQNHPMTYASPSGLFDAAWHKYQADLWKKENDYRVNRSKGRGIPSTEGCAWDGILAEELHETFAETDPVKQAAEALQAAGVAVAILEYLVRTHPEVRDLMIPDPFDTGEPR